MVGQHASVADALAPIHRAHTKNPKPKKQKPESESEAENESEAKKNEKFVCN